MHVPYAQYVRHTFLRIMSTLPLPPTQDFPLQFQIADGIDGSGRHTVYNQTITNTEMKYSFYSALDKYKSPLVVLVYFENLNPNSPFTQRPIFLHAAKENEENIKQFMNDIVNSDTEQM